MLDLFSPELYVSLKKFAIVLVFLLNHHNMFCVFRRNLSKTVVEIGQIWYNY